MAKRIIIISSFPVCIILGVLALIFFGIGKGQAQQQMSIDSARSHIIELADTGKAAEIDDAIDKFTVDYSGRAELPTNLLIIADSLAWRRLYTEADRLYRLTADLSSNDNSTTTKARLGLARVEVLDLIGKKKYSAAREHVNYMSTDFRDEPDLAMALLQVGQEFFWKGSHFESRDTFNILVETCSKSPLTQQAKLWSARANICALIWQHTLLPNAQRAKDEDIVTAIDNLIGNFKDDSGLADALLSISRHYEWAKGPVDDRNGWYDPPNSVYQRLVQHFGNTASGQQADWDQKRLTYRMKILKLIKDANQIEVDTAIKDMAGTIKDRPELAGEFCWIAREYELYPEKREFAKQTYQRIIQEYSDSTEAREARLDIPRVDIQSLIEAGDINKAKVLTDKFIADFNEDPYAGSCLGRVAIQYYKSAFDFRKNKQREQAKLYFEQAQSVWQQIIDKTAVQAGDTDNAYFFAASCRQQQAKWDGAIEYYQKLVDDWPDYKLVGGAQCAIGWCLEVLRDEGKIPKEQADTLIEQAYTTVLTKYSDCYTAHYAAFQLAEISDRKGDKANAISYYKKYLELAKPGYSDITKAQARLAKLEGINK